MVAILSFWMKTIFLTGSLIFLELWPSCQAVWYHSWLVLRCVTYAVVLGRQVLPLVWKISTGNTFTFDNLGFYAMNHRLELGFLRPNTFFFFNKNELRSLAARASRLHIWASKLFWLLRPYIRASKESWMFTWSLVLILELRFEM